ncbi:uncharacterized protein LOC121374916 [Gigantopelta aegis]|uniref:uncharacterized protein LOC121374916 n=1 Tax=Gigantopelta aegis TaxID=1735272 RepID=UPI001B8874D9|nr:uncharacterized protein LOC121374916 [Gigantopelta aegis]
MADWSADVGLENGYHGDSLHSRQSSMSSDKSSLSRHNQNGGHGVLLFGGHLLGEESGTEQTTVSNGFRANGKSVPSIPPRESMNKMKQAPSPPSITVTDDDSLPEQEIEIPKDGCLFNFTADEMSIFFRHLRVSERLVKHLHKKNVDGKRFSRFKDTELDTLGMRNPVVTYFRDRSVKKSKPKSAFIL